MSDGNPARVMAPTLPILSVSELNQAVSKMLEKNFPLVWISGEISNFTRAASGHWYFTLKDAGAQVRAVMFRARAQYAEFKPQEGDKVEVRALVTLYAPRGDYQISVEAIRRSGVGNLYEAFLQLKDKLNAEGLFDAQKKRHLPIFPKTIGIVSSTKAAALHDILTALRRRAPHIHLILYPTPVQGEGSARKIAQAITTASARAECDVLLVCRGGGSIEDLWSFNEEIVARAVADCAMPVISGVGHETDFTITDFAADLRAPTPTAAAEMAATSHAEWLGILNAQISLLSRSIHRKIDNSSQTLDWLARRVVNPSTAMRQERLKLGALQSRLIHATSLPLKQSRFSLIHLHTRLKARAPDSTQSRGQLSYVARRLSTSVTATINTKRHTLTALTTQLELLNPQRTLGRGYAMVIDAKGKLVRAPKDLHPRSLVTICLAEGSAQVGLANVQATLD